jgi:hypothetical protein
MTNVDFDSMDEDELLEAARNKELPADVLGSMVDLDFDDLDVDGDDILAALAGNPSISRSTMYELAELGDSVSFGLLDNPNTPAEILLEVADNSTDEYTHRAVIAHQNVSAAILDMVSHHRDPWVRWDVVKHEKVYVKTLRRLSTDDEVFPATHPNDNWENTPEEEQPYILIAIAANPKTPKDVVDKVNHRIAEIQSAAGK